MHLPDKSTAYSIKELLGFITLAEIIQLLGGLRAACRFTAPVSQEPAISNIVAGLGLQYVRSTFPIQRQANVHMGSFSQDAAGNDGPFYYYLAGNHTIATAAYASEGRDATIQGKLFGYPTCCTHFFDQKFNTGT